MAGCRGTSPQEVLEARGDTGLLPTACPTSCVQPRDVIQRVQGDTPFVPRLRWQLWALRPGLDGSVPHFKGWRPRRALRGAALYRAITGFFMEFFLCGPLA